MGEERGLYHMSCSLASVAIAIWDRCWRSKRGDLLMWPQGYSLLGHSTVPAELSSSPSHKQVLKQQLPPFPKWYETGIFPLSYVSLAVF